MDLPLVCPERSGLYATILCRQLKMDGKDDYINAVGYISSSLSETELPCNSYPRKCSHLLFSEVESMTYALLQEYPRKKSPIRDFLLKGKYIVEKGNML